MTDTSRHIICCISGKTPLLFLYFSPAANCSVPSHNTSGHSCAACQALRQASHPRTVVASQLFWTASPAWGIFFLLGSIILDSITSIENLLPSGVHHFGQHHSIKNLLSSGVHLFWTASQHQESSSLWGPSQTMGLPTCTFRGLMPLKNQVAVSANRWLPPM